MAQVKAIKEKTVKEYQRHGQDTASPEVQVALITHRLKYLNDHFSKHPKDHHSKTGLLKLVGKRRRLLNYFKKRDYDGYRQLISQLGIRK